MIQGSAFDEKDGRDQAINEGSNDIRCYFTKNKI